MNREIVLTEDQISLFNSGHRIYLNNGEIWSYYPYWIQEKDGKRYIVSPDRLPQEVIDLLNEKRNES